MNNKSKPTDRCWYRMLERLYKKPFRSMFDFVAKILSLFATFVLIIERPDGSLTSILIAVIILTAVMWLLLFWFTVSPRFRKIMMTIDVPETEQPGQVDKENINEVQVVGYARVCSSDHFFDLDRQEEKILEWCKKKGLEITSVVMEVNSGLKDPQRQKLQKLLADPNVRTIVVENRDSISRFNVSCLERSLETHGSQILTVDMKTPVPDSPEAYDDMYQDATDTLDLLCESLMNLNQVESRIEKDIQIATVGYTPPLFEPIPEK